MKTLYVGVPVVGRKYSSVLNDIRCLHEVAEKLFDEDLEVLDVYRVGELKERTLMDWHRHNDAKISADYSICIYGRANKTGPIKEPITV